METPDGEIRCRDPRLARVWEKVRAGERLDAADGVACLETSDLLALGRMADFVKRKKSGDWVYFVINRYINPTNVCVLSCAFRDFAHKKGEAGAFEQSAEDIVRMIDPDIREVHIVGGHHPPRGGRRPRRGLMLTTPYCNSVRVAGDEMDEAIVQFIKKQHNLLVGERQAEEIKITLGSAYPTGGGGEPRTMQVKGRDLLRS